MRNSILVPSLIVLMGIIFIYGLSVGVYKIFPYELLDSSLDAIKEGKTIENNEFIIQSDLDSLVKIDDELDIIQKRNDIKSGIRELKFIQNEIATVGKNTNPTNVVDAASAVVASMKQKLQNTQKELDLLKKALEEERKTKNISSY